MILPIGKLSRVEGGAAGGIARKTRTCDFIDYWIRPMLRALKAM